jgi:uncharacterized protein
MPFYLDTSSFLKLLVEEQDSVAMREWFEEGHSCWASQLLATEALRAAQRLGLDSDAVDHALETVSLVLTAAATFRVAGTLPPPQLRSLDALHLASALELGGDLEGVVTYDARLIDGVLAAGLQVVKPAGAGDTVPEN